MTLATPFKAGYRAEMDLPGALAKSELSEGSSVADATRLCFGAEYQALKDLARFIRPLRGSQLV